MLQRFQVPKFLLLALLGLPLLSACGGRPIEARYIVSESMAPALQVNDRVIIQKFSKDSAPQRGDIVLFHPPDRAREIYAELDPKVPFLFRVVGLPGETIAIKQGKVYINNQPITEPYITQPATEDLPSIQVPANSFIVLGDNRNNAFDSRYWGAVPRDRILGKAVSRFYPFDRMGEIK
jgi:signal peptidase I